MALILVPALVGSVYIIGWLLYTYFFSPLSKLPNAGLFAPISRLLWEFPNEVSGDITLALPKLHERLGPLVRIGPKQVSFYDLEIYKRVHSPRSPFVKDPRVYSQFVQDGHPALFSITDSNEHAQRRRHMGVLFNRSKVPALTPMMLEEIGRFLDMLKTLQKKGTIDLGETCRALEADLVSRFGFGNRIGAIDAIRTGQPLGIVKENDARSSTLAIDVSFPRIKAHWDMMRETLGFKSEYTKQMEVFAIWSNNQLELNMDAEKASELSFLKVMAGARISPQAALSEAKEMLGPGTDTTSATLAHILWALSFNQQYQQELFDDLVIAGWPTDMSELEALPRLTAAVKEGIRWTGAAAAMLPRIVPPEGATLAGHFLPGGTMISSSPIWYLREPSAYPDPFIYRPSRWLGQEDSDITILRDQYYVPFSKGPGICVGMHFAYLELYLSASQLLHRYRILPVGNVEEGSSVEVTLPPRKEWVAAVPTMSLKVTLKSRE